LGHSAVACWRRRAKRARRRRRTGEKRSGGRRRVVMTGAAMGGNIFIMAVCNVCMYVCMYIDAGG
jgi:hypothetical protein